jgi:predicted nucleic-acid-binding protein
MAALDTNVLVRLLSQDDPALAKKAEAHLAAFDKDAAKLPGTTRL